MLLNLNEQKKLTQKTKNRKIFLNSLLINFILVVIVVLSLSSKESTDSALLTESRKVYEENKALKEFIDTKLKDYETKNDSIFELGLNLSTNNSFYIVNDTFNVKYLSLIIDNNSKILNSVGNELNVKWDSVYNVPVFMPLASTDFDRISDYFGWRKHPIYKKWIYHNGIDIVAKYKAEILATSDGVVVKKIKSKYGYGNRIVLDHGNGFKTLYAHLYGFNVNIGDSVKRGGVIGYMGSTGLSTGTHLHYEILKNNKQQNPIDYMYDLAKK